MRRSFGSLIIFQPASPRIHRLHYTRRAIRLLIIAVVIAVSLVVGLRFTILQPVPESERARLQSENDALRLKNKNLEMEAKRLQSRISTLEETSNRLTDMAHGAD